MGGGLSKNIASFEQDLSYLDIGRVEMKAFYKIFRKIATEKDQQFVTVAEILQFAKVPYSPFAAKALCCGFCYVSPSESEESELRILASFKFDYLTFVYTVWNFLTLCPEALTSFMFSIYDADGGGSIDPQEAQVLLKDLHGDDFGGSLDVIREYNKFAMLVRKNIDLERFQSFAADNEKIFAPAFDLQDKLTARIMGALFWYIHTKKRKQLYLLNYKHVTRVVDKVRIMREKEMELDWESGGVGNKKYAPSSSHPARRGADSKPGASPSPQVKADILVLDDSPAPSSPAPRPHDATPPPKKSAVSFALGLAEDKERPASPMRFMKKSGTSKYFFGSRPNTPSKQLAYFLDKFYEKPGQVKVTADSREQLTPYSMIKTGRADKPAVMPTMQAVVESNFMVQKKKYSTDSPSAVRSAKKNKKEEILKSITDVRTFARGQEFWKKNEEKAQPAKPPPVRKLTKAQTRLMKTRQKRQQLGLL
mmetsp:Transcript_22987/g.38906  ORF Transcript_22987/g.38906 Transcript_22987/m.38906 type:complete len:479 (+) Transcript_22987:208-1644(+)